MTELLRDLDTNGVQAWQDSSMQGADPLMSCEERPINTVRLQDGGADEYAVDFDYIGFKHHS